MLLNIKFSGGIFDKLSCNTGHNVSIHFLLNRLCKLRIYCYMLLRRSKYKHLILKYIGAQCTQCSENEKIFQYLHYKSVLKSTMQLKYFRKFELFYIVLLLLSF